MNDESNKRFKFGENWKNYLASIIIKPKKNIVYIIGQLDIGGAETHLLKILPRLNSLEYNVKLFSLFTMICLKDNL